MEASNSAPTPIAVHNALQEYLRCRDDFIKATNALEALVHEHLLKPAQAGAPEAHAASLEGAAQDAEAPAADAAGAPEAHSASQEAAAQDAEIPAADRAPADAAAAAKAARNKGEQESVAATKRRKVAAAAAKQAERDAPATRAQAVAAAAAAAAAAATSAPEVETAERAEKEAAVAAEKGAAERPKKKAAAAAAERAGKERAEMEAVAAAAAKRAVKEAAERPEDDAAAAAATKRGQDRAAGVAVKRNRGSGPQRSAKRRVVTKEMTGERVAAAGAGAVSSSAVAHSKTGVAGGGVHPVACSRSAKAAAAHHMRQTFAGGSATPPGTSEVPVNARSGARDLNAELTDLSLAVKTSYGEWPTDEGVFIDIAEWALKFVREGVTEATLARFADMARQERELAAKEDQLEAEKVRAKEKKEAETAASKKAKRAKTAALKRAQDARAFSVGQVVQIDLSAWEGCEGIVDAVVVRVEDASPRPDKKRVFVVCPSDFDMAKEGGSKRFRARLQRFIRVFDGTAEGWGDMQDIAARVTELPFNSWIIQ
eukprot:TRINITY_DN400_c1_g1_i1.p1 TRINITY_DN400_c1_g1~~TRINITY_DN400_c1_g1_i1.p1  ORF type:complete len:542 (+),score=167.89 TRINITY_DN400_c1_g1_i1:217-1842(+)